MIFRREFLEKIKKGEVRVAYRKWNECRIKVGSSLMTALGVIRILSIKQVEEKSLTLTNARAAGHDSLEILLKELNQRGGGQVYRIGLKFVGEDPRIKLRGQMNLSPEEKRELQKKLERLDKASKQGPWTLSFLQLLKKHPGVSSKELFQRTAFEQLAFKLHVRKLKNLGLTISLGTGYELSPRGKSYLKAMKKLL